MNITALRPQVLVFRYPVVAPTDMEIWQVVDNFTAGAGLRHLPAYSAICTMKGAGICALGGLAPAGLL